MDRMSESRIRRRRGQLLSRLYRRYTDELVARGVPRLQAEGAAGVGVYGGDTRIDDYPDGPEFLLPEAFEVWMEDPAFRRLFAQLRKLRGGEAVR